MEKAGILDSKLQESFGNWGPVLILSLLGIPRRERPKGLLLGGLLLSGLLFCVASPAWSGAELAGHDRLAAGDKYRQINLMLMIAEGIEPAFIEQLLPPPAAGTNTQAVLDQIPQLNVEDFQTPLNRIVDQRTLITNAAHVFRYTQDNRASLMLALTEVAAAEPAAVGQVDLILLAEDAIIIRTALAGSIEYLARDGDPAMLAYLEIYQSRTVYLRNVMEYWKFNQELTAITADAMDTTGGKMEAYQRMLEDEPDLHSFKQHLRAVEAIYRQTTGRKIDPEDLLSKDLIDDESQVP